MKGEGPKCKRKMNKGGGQVLKYYFFGIISTARAGRELKCPKETKGLKKKGIASSRAFTPMQGALKHREAFRCRKREAKDAG